MPRPSRRIAPPPACAKRGFSPLHRPHQGRAEREAPRRLRRAGARPGPAAHRGPGERSSRRDADAAKTPACQGTDRRPGGRQRPLQGRTRNPRHRRLYPLNALAQAAHPARPNALPPAPPQRNHVRQTQGLATHRHAPRPMRTHPPLRHHTPRNRDWLVMSPDPRVSPPLASVRAVLVGALWEGLGDGRGVLAELPAVGGD